MKIPQILALIAVMLLCSCRQSSESETGVTSESEQEVRAVDTVNSGSRSESETNLQPYLREGEKHKIAVVISGVWEDFPDYSEVFYGIIKGLAQIGWMDEIDDANFFYDSEQKKIKEVIDIITMIEEGSYSEFLHFSSDLYFDLEWDPATAVGNKTFDALITEKGGVNLIIALGTNAGEALKGSPHLAVPVLADSISDPLGSKIIDSYEDSGSDFITVRVDPDRYKRQVRMFYDVVGFKKLGIIYEDTPNGRTYGAVADILKVSQERGFEVIHNTNVLPAETNLNITSGQYKQKYLDALDQVCKNSDAVYLGIVQGLSSENIPAILEVINKYKLSSFAMKGSAYVKQGILFGISESEETVTGIHNAKNMVMMLRGKKARDIRQIFEHVPHIAINLEEARLIGYDIPIDIIASSDEIYTTIE